MFKKNHKKVTTEVQVTEVKENNFSSLPTAKDAYAQTQKIQKSNRNDFPVLTQNEIVSEIQRRIKDGHTWVDFYNQKLTDKDNKTLEDLGYIVEIVVPTYSSMIKVSISWEK